MSDKRFCPVCGDELEENDGEFTCRNANGCVMYNIEVMEEDTTDGD